MKGDSFRSAQSHHAVLEVCGAGQHQETRRLLTPTNICGLWTHSCGLGVEHIGIRGGIERRQGRAAAGYESFAPGWPGDPDTVEVARANPDSIADHGIDDVTNHYGAFIDQLPARPILIGHSFGGMIAEKLLGLDYGAAAIGIDANKHRAVSLTAEQFPLQLRQRRRRGGVQRAVRAVDDPRP